MLKQLLVFATLLPLTSCIPVEDFGAYWDKAGLDKALAGDWKQVPATAYQSRAQGYPIGDVMHIVAKGDAYEISFSDEGKAETDNPLYPVKTLAAGPHRLLAAGPKKGGILLYRLRGRTLEFCNSFGPVMLGFVQKHYPDALNIRRQGQDLTIALFDEEVFAILSKLPANENFGICATKFERVP